MTIFLNPGSPQNAVSILCQKEPEAIDVIEKTKNEWNDPSKLNDTGKSNAITST